MYPKNHAHGSRIAVFCRGSVTNDFTNILLGSISRTIFSFVMQIRWHFLSALIPSCIKGIAMKCCTCHDSCTFVACATFCSDMIPYNWVTLKQLFHRIWIMIEKSFVKWAQVYSNGTRAIIRLSMCHWRNTERYRFINHMDLQEIITWI